MHRAGLELGWGANLMGSYGNTVITFNMVLVNTGFHTSKNFSTKYLQIWTDALRKVQQPCPGLKKF
jgi:hypothetical protein